ncbi:NAD dehydrogenase [Lentinula boryana]|uniref:L-2-hydroxyglutarate dehydrogenase, mitochondrial n=1 Tax=Lentinula boryana TaxID=40481 RepID=A0ABQ8QJ86_9AGAR|nr:NAD dehydrogenase [Lentinula boryana]
MKLTVRGLAAALNSSGNFKKKAPEIAVDHLVIGAGVVGLAIAQRLCEKFPMKTTYLIERHARAGEETRCSSADHDHHFCIYYPADSLKTRLCLRGRELMYQRCRTLDIPHRKTGKLIVAKTNQRSYIENLHLKALKLPWPPHSAGDVTSSPVLPTELISGDEARAMEPNLSRDISAALWCPETGIVDSHSFMESLEKDILESETGDLAYATRVVRVDPYSTGSSKVIPGGQGWVVQTVTGNEGQTESDAILARTVFNASGLSGPFILNSLLPPERRIPMYYARGSYASYRGPGISGISHLIYPCPDTGPNAHAFASLGTHLTLDLNGKIRFGPDIEFLSPPTSEDSEENMDYWTKHLSPDDSRLEQMHLAIKQYIPEVAVEGLQPDYVGIRPKLIPPGAGFQDFVFRTDYPCDFGGIGLVGESPMISLLGIESPGLTSSLAIAEYVVDDLLSSTKSAQ